MSAGTPYVAGSVTLSFNSVVITNIKSFNGPAMEMGNVESTVLGAASKSYLPTLYDVGVVSGTIEYDPADTSHAGLSTAFLAKTVASTVVTLKSGDTWTFSGFVSKFELAEVSNESVTTVNFEIRTTGPVTIATS